MSDDTAFPQKLDQVELFLLSSVFLFWSPLCLNLPLCQHTGRSEMKEEAAFSDTGPLLLLNKSLMREERVREL